MIVTQKEFAEMAGVSAPAVSKLIRQGKLPVTDDRRIDTDDEICRKYMNKKGAAPLQPQEKHDDERAAMMERRAAGVPPSRGGGRRPESGDGITKSDVMSRRDLELKKLAAQLQEIELKNAIKEGRLVAREVVVNGVWNPIETFLVRILSDGAKTMSKTVYPIVKSGGTREEVEVAIRRELTSFIVPLKESIQKALKLEEL